jgi:adenine-specific DNA-methyltransferase
MQNLQTELIKLLEKDERFIKDGKLLKNSVIEAALKLDPSLLKLLLSHKSLKKHFFQQVVVSPLAKGGETEGVFVFDKIEFQKFVSNKSFLKDSYTAYTNKIGLTVDDEFISEGKQVVLSWPYKDCVLEGGQTKEDEKRNEIFWNETLAPDEIDRLLSPKVFTNFKKYDSKSEHTVTDISLEDNLIIKGNNLLALYSLLPVYSNKIKLIYIDPPYNSPGEGNTFSYNNTFNHSTWLTFISNRIQVAKSLLRQDGVLAIAIDDGEQAYLKIVCDEIFDRDNHIGTLIIQTKPSGRTTDTYFATSHEYVLFYAKESGAPEINFFELTAEQKKAYKEGEGENSYKWRDFLRTGGLSTPEERPNSYYPIYFNPKTQHISLKSENSEYIEILPLDSTGKKRVWRKTPSSFLTHLSKDEIKVIHKNTGDWKVQIIDRIKKGTRPKSVWIDSKYDAATHGTKLLKELFQGKKIFSYPKSLYAVKDVIDLFTEQGGDDIILDFFSGSGTTAHAVLELNKEDEGNRKVILCEQMGYVENVTFERVKKVIDINKDGSIIYSELAKLNNLFIEQIVKSNTLQELKQIWYSIKKDGFISYKVNPTDFDSSMTEFEELSLEDQKKFLVAVLDKNHLYVNYSEIEDKDYKISDEDKKLNKKFYSLK